MKEYNLSDLEKFLKDEMLQLKLMSLTIKKASKKFNLTKNEVKDTYLLVRSSIKKEAVNRGLVYFLLSSIFLFVGIKSIDSNSGYIYLGGLLFGTFGFLTAIGYFFMALKGKSK